MKNSHPTLFRQLVTALSLAIAMTGAYCKVDVAYARENITALEQKTVSLDIEFGNAQLVQMIKDRPSMANFVSPGDELWRELAKRFAGAEIGHKIRWNSEAIDKPIQYIADHCFPSSAEPDCYIRLRKFDERGRQIPGEELWAALCYEFENLRNNKAFYDLYSLALTGRFTKKEWIRKNTELEYIAVKRSAWFYKRSWLPYMRKKGLKSNPVNWSLPVPATYEEWIREYDTSNNGIYDYWADYYDEKIVPWLLRHQQHL